MNKRLLILIFLLANLNSWLQAQQGGAFHFIANKEDPSKSILYYLFTAEEQASVKRISFKVYSGKKMEGPTVYGTFETKDNRLVFTPFYAWSAGQNYTAVWEGDAAQKSIFEFSIPQKFSTPPELLTIYPTQDTLPANQLKLYLKFSKPMALAYVYEMVEVYDDMGQLLEKPFLELQPELWDAEGKQICLWFDPGRIKRDLKPNMELGTPLEEGKHYRLVLKKDWPDRENQMLKNSFEKTFFVEPADRNKPSITNWKVLLPDSNKEKLQIIFPEAMDASALSKIEVLEPDGKLVQGETELQTKEKSWIFYPIKPWKKGFYKIRVDAKLEDLAGNNLNRLFDRDLLDPRQDLGKEAFYWLMFEIR